VFFRREFLHETDDRFLFARRWLINTSDDFMRCQTNSEEFVSEVVASAVNFVRASSTSFALRAP
jgi:hypothetical protein